MRKIQGIIIGVLLVAVAMVYRHLHKVESEAAVSSQATGSATGSASSGATGSTLGGPSSGTSTSGASVLDHEQDAFTKQLQKEAENISQLQDNPEEVQNRLKELASKMGEQEIQTLRETALNTSLDGDQRFLSVHLLGESSSTKAQESLEVIAAAPIPPQGDARFANQEEVLRAKAVESLREAESIKRVLARTDNHFIVDHAQRSLLYREGKNSKSPEVQDQEALNLLLQKTRRQ